jgi:hypothetical protein
MMPSMTTDSSKRPAAAIAIAIAIVGAGALALVGFAAVRMTRTDTWTNVVPATDAVTPVFFHDSALLRMNNGTVERVDALGSKQLPLAGTPRVFARGPNGTIAFQTGSEPLHFHKIAADGGAPVSLAFKAALPVVKYVVTGQAVAERGTPLVIVSTSGVGALWSCRTVDVDPGPQLVKPMMNMRVAHFTEDGEHLYVAYYDGGIDRFELAAGTPTQSLAARGMVRALASKDDLVVVADDVGVRWFNKEAGKLIASFPLPNIVTLAYGDDGDLRVLTSDAATRTHALHVVHKDPRGHASRTSAIPIPAGEKPVAFTTTKREVLVATDKGGVWQLLIP